MIRTLLFSNELNLNCNEITLNSNSSSAITIIAQADSAPKTITIPSNGGMNATLAYSNSNANGGDISSTITINYIPQVGPDEPASNISASYINVNTFYLLSCQWNFLNPIPNLNSQFIFAITLPPGITYGNIYGFTGTFLDVTNGVNSYQNLLCANVIASKVNSVSDTKLQVQYYYGIIPPNTFPSEPYTLNFSLNVIIFSTGPA